MHYKHEVFLTPWEKKNSREPVVFSDGLLGLSNQTREYWSFVNFSDSLLQPKQRTKRKLQGSEPPKNKAKEGKTSETDCLICLEPSLEADDHCVGEDAVFCEGQCQGWLHRKCAGVTRPAFEKLGESEDVFLCTYCMLISQNNKISKLFNILNKLISSVTCLTKTIKSLQSSVRRRKQHQPTLNPRSFCAWKISWVFN